MIWAWIGATFVGLSLGLLGSGGAILTVPILVYLVGHTEKSAIAESLAIVGAIAIAGTIRASLQGRVDFRNAALLAIPGILGTVIGKQIAMHVPGEVQLGLLAILMFTAAFLMFRTNGAKRGAGGVPQPSTPALDAAAQEHAVREAAKCPLWIIGLQGAGLGIATTLVGVGGGFLIVPVLVLLRKLPMPLAVGTSLAIISVNSTSGFLQHLAAAQGWFGEDKVHAVIDWHIVGIFAALGVGGSLVGNMLAGKIYPATLKKIFAVFLVVMAAYILYRQAPKVWPETFGGETRHGLR